MNAPTVHNYKSEVYVVIGIIFVIIAIEFTLRLFEDRLSGNIANIFTIPEVTSQIDNTTDQSIVFIGNSLTFNAVDPDVVQEILRKDGYRQYQILKVTPDSTAIADWYCIYRNQFTNIKKAPALIVIGFAWEQVSDQERINPTRLGGLFCDIDDIAPLSVTQLEHHQQKLRFLAGTASHVYVNREAIRNRILNLLIPDYIKISRRMNRSANDTDSRTNAEKNYSYHLLADLVSHIHKNGSDVIIMAMPVIQPYNMDKKLIYAAAEMNVPLLDLRQTGAFSEDMFMDPIHLNKEGSAVFSKLIARRLQPIIDNRTGSMSAMH